MEEKLNEFNKKKVTMTAADALNEDIVIEKEKNITDLMKKRELVEDTHTRNTFLVRNDLMERLNNLSEGRHGFKTKFINYVIEMGLNELKEK